MTGTQYKNIIDNTLLDESLEGVTDSVAIARAVFDNCGVPLPQGNCSEIMSALASDDFVGWRKCTLEEAQEHANNGIAAIGISDDRILIIEPQEEGVISSNLPETAAYSSTMVTANSFSQVDEGGMVFYADTMATTTVEEYYRITGKPANNTMFSYDTVTLGIESSFQFDAYYTVWSSSNTNVAFVSPTSRSTTSVLQARAEGTTVITARNIDLNRSDSFTLTVRDTYKIIDKPANNTMTVGETKTISIESNIGGIESDTTWDSSNDSVATMSPDYGSASTVITALAPGSTIISANNPSHFKGDEFTLTVKPAELIITGLPENNTIYVGETMRTNAFLSPDLSNDCHANWSCSSNGFSFNHIFNNHQGISVDFMEIVANKPGLHTINVAKGVLSYSFKVFVIKQLYLTNNQCYLESPNMTQVKGIMVHSTGANNWSLRRYVGPNDGLLGNNSYNHWNVYHPGHNVDGQYKDSHNYTLNSMGECKICGGKPVCVHAFIGKLENGSVATYQTLPWNKKGWHSGSGSSGSSYNANNTGFIGFEICENIYDPNKFDTPEEKEQYKISCEEYFYKSYYESIGLCAYLCKIYNIDPLQHNADGGIISHKEGYSLGIASNHGDPTHWWNAYNENNSYKGKPEYAYLNKTMDDFRRDVKALIDNNMQF